MDRKVREDVKAPSGSCTFGPNQTTRGQKHTELLEISNMFLEISRAKLWEISICCLEMSWKSSEISKRVLRNVHEKSKNVLRNV